MRLRSLVAFALLLVTGASGAAWAQSQAINGTIEGTVKDPQGGALPGVTVTIIHVDTGAQRVVLTNDAGVYRAPLLPLGNYRIQYELPSFMKRERTGVALTAGQIIVLNEIMEPGVSEFLTVTAETPAVDLAKTDVGRNLTEVEIKNLPNVARNPYNYALLEPGVTGFENEEFGVPRFAINGQMLRVNYQIDGNTNTQKDRAGLRLMPISEVMIQEVQIVSAGYAPEFGQTTGMVYNAVTPSGANAIRGDVGYRFRRKSFSACPFSTNTACRDDPAANKPDNSLDIVTATIGGPIVRGRLFYYGGYEYTYQKLPRQVTIRPEIAAAVGVAAQPLSVASYRATPFYIGKLDYQINPMHRLSSRTNTFTNDNPYQSGGGTTAIERGNDFKDFMISSAVQLISTLGTDNLNELRFQVARRKTTRPPSHPETTGPSITISGTAQQGGIQFGPYTGIGNDFIQRNIQLLDNFTLLRGRHSYKAGFDLQLIHDHRGTALPVIYTFPSVQAYLDARSGVNRKGYTTFQQTLGTPDFNMDNALASWFVQDDFKITSNVKILYGVRHDLYLYPKGIPGSPYSEKFTRDYNNLAPRLGGAWTIGDRTVIRASTGLNYDQPLLAIIETAYANSGLAARTTSFSLNPSSPFAPDFPNDLSAIPPTVVQVSSTVEGMDPAFVNARTWQNNVSYERQFGRDYAVSVSVRHSRGWNLPVITDVNLAGVAPVRYLEDGRGVYSSAINATTRVDPRYNRIRLVQSIGESWYKGVTFGLNKRWSNGIQYNLNYSWGKGEDTAPLGGTTLAIQGDAARSDPVDLGRDRAPNQLDIRHTFNGSIVAISSVKRFGPLLNRILSDNQIGLILLVNSGEPDGLTGNRDLNLDGVNNDRPLFITRNSMHAPVRKNVDLRYSRFFQLGGNRRLEVQAETKNLFNVEQVSAISNTIPVDLDGYPVDAVTGARLPLDSISLNTDDYAANNWREQRKFQLGFKFFF